MRLLAILTGLVLLTASVAHAEDGHDLWLRYRPVEATAGYAPAAIAPVADTPTLKVARAELERGSPAWSVRPRRRRAASS